MLQPGRKYSATDGYRYGFNGKENDNDVKGEGNQQDYGMRIYDSRLGRFLSVDLITKEYPELTPYQFASNRPIAAIDLDGLEAKDAITGITKNEFKKASAIAKKSYQPWLDLMTFKSSNSLYTEANKRHPMWIGKAFQRQTIAGAYSDDVNLDYYSVKISKLPPAFENAGELFQHIRCNFGSFMGKDDAGTEFSAFDDKESKIWNSSNPVGAVMHFDIYMDGMNVEDANVITIASTKDYWLFETVKTSLGPEDGEHPVAGIRQFGIIQNEDGSVTFYIRGADSPYGYIDTQNKESIFNGASNLWTTLMSNLAKKINSEGGSASTSNTNAFRTVSYADDIKDTDKTKIKEQKNGQE